MKRVRVRTYSGTVLEVEDFNVGDRAEVRKAAYKPRFENEEDRAKHRLEISRRNHTRLFNENFSPRSLYSTLTFDEENEVHSARECRLLRDKYYRKLKTAFPDGVIALYYGMGKNTSRFHLHMVSDGIPEDVIRTLWIYGEVTRIVHLREHCYYDGADRGTDYAGLANYLFDHWREEFGGHRWKMSRNARRPEREKPKEVKRIYTETKPPRAPKGYVQVEAVSNRYGWACFRYVREDTVKRRE